MTQNQYRTGYRPGPELKNAAKECLAGWYGALVPALLTAMAATLPFVFWQSGLESVTSLLLREVPVLFSILLVHLLSTVSLALRGLLNTGFLLLELKIACGSPFVFWDLFYCFSGNQFKRAFGTAICVNLPKVICTLPSAVLTWQFLQNPSPLMGFYALLAFLLGSLACLPILLCLSMSYFLLLDFPEYGPGKILALSHRLMKGNKGRLLLLELSFLPLHFLAIFSMGIGYLWLEPYLNMARTLFYLDLMNRQS